MFNKIIKYLIIILLTSFISCSKDNKKELCYEVLDLEKKAGYQIDTTCYLLLDSIINDAEIIIKKKDEYTFEDACKIFYRISDILDYYNLAPYINKSPSLIKNELFSTSLKNRQLDCECLCYIYLSIAGRLNLPIYGIILPQHTFLIWKGKKFNLYWETLYSTDLSRQHYLTTHKIPYSFIEKVSNKRFISVAYNTIGLIKMNNGEISESFELFKSAIDKNPKYQDPLLNIASAHIHKGNLDRANDILMETLEMNPNNPYIFNNLSAVNIKNKNYKDALEHCNKAIKLDSNFAHAYCNRGICYLKMYNYDKACRNFRKSNELGLKSAKSFLNKYCY